MTTLLAFLSYSSSLLILYLAGSAFSAVNGGVAWLVTGAFAVPFVYLLYRLYAYSEEPWSGLAWIIFAPYLFCSLSILIAWPGMFSTLPLKSAVGAQAEKLRYAREKLSSYIEANSAVPKDLSPVLPEMPTLKLPLTPHKTGSAVRVSAFADIQDSGGWLYVSDSTAPALLIDCTHPDHKGKPWSAY